MAKNEKKSAVNRDVSISYTEEKGYDINMDGMTSIEFIKFIGTASASIVKNKDLPEAERELVLAFQEARAKKLEPKEPAQPKSKSKPKPKPDPKPENKPAEKTEDPKNG